MKLPFHLVIAFAHKNQPEMQKAFGQFFGQTSFPESDQEEIAYPLFSEWLTFDYKQANGLSFLADYLLRNPDNLDKKMLDSLQQVLASHWYGEFEIAGVSRSSFLLLEHLYSGKKVKVYDKSSTATIPPEGTLHARLGKVNGKWYFVGSNPNYMPLTHTKRMKALLRKEIDPAKLTPIDTWRLISHKTSAPPEETKQDIANKQQLLKHQYEDVMKRVGNGLSFESLVAIIFKENSAQPLDLFMSLTKKGMPEEILFTETQLLQDIWNYFPHKILHGKSPAEIFQKLSQEQKKNVK